MRTLGALNISVGTSLALEGEVIAALPKCDTFLVNLKTLVRNAMQAYEKDDPDKNDKALVVAAVIEDIMGVANFLKEKQANRSMVFVLYHPSYKDLPKLFSRAQLWTPTTEGQIKLAEFTEKVYKVLLERLKGTVLLTNSQFPDFKGEGYVITHHPVDLVLTPGAHRLKLVESHTGSLKGHAQWYTKLTGGEHLMNMPLNKLTIQIFGDKSVNFKSESFKIKELVKRVAKDGRWTSASTLDRVRGSINTYAMGFDRAGLLALLN